MARASSFVNNVPLAHLAPKSRLVNASVPPSRRVPTAGKPRTLLGWEVNVALSLSFPADVIEMDPHDGAITMWTTTYAWLKHDTQAIQRLGSEKAEAVRTMKTRMVDTSQWKSAKIADPARKAPAPVPGIKQLCHELQGLVQDLARLDPENPTAVSDVAGRYGKMRDTMAGLRLAFIEAEGSFEVAQDLLVQKMGIE